MGRVNSVDWVKVTQVILNVAQTLALVVGGFWVYFKFIRSRTFARRAALDVDGSFLSVEGRSLIRVEVVLRNTGLSKIPLRANRQVLTLWATSTSDFSSNTNLSWHFWMVSQVFTTDQSVESQEAIKDVALLPVASEGGPWLAFPHQGGGLGGASLEMVWSGEMGHPHSSSGPGRQCSYVSTLM